MKRPSIKDVAAELRFINANVECDSSELGSGYCDVRLQMYENGIWVMRHGLSDYDHDHRGYWGASCIPGIQNGVVKRFNSREVAKDLINQVEDHYTQSQASA